MNLGRYAWTGSVAFLLALQVACGGKVDGLTALPPEPATPPDHSKDGPTDATRGVQPDAPATGGDGAVEDSHTLRVDIVILAGNPDQLGDWPDFRGTITADSEETMTVHLLVSVTDPDSSAQIVDARVTGGPMGHPSPLVLGTTTANSPYLGGRPYVETVVGYHQAWEFSIVRGTDYLKGVAVVGPPYPSLTVVDSYRGWPATWSPGQRDAAISVCAYAGAPTVTEAWCASGSNDQGSVFLTPKTSPFGGGWPTWFFLTEYAASGPPVGSRGGTWALRLGENVKAP